MVTYRKATTEDIDSISLLHTKSWQENYRGSLSDDFLDNHALSDRKKVWHERLEKSDSKIRVTVAEAENVIVGFVCILYDHSTTYGTLLDNLHVSSRMQGKRIGAQLMYLMAHAIKKRYGASGMYLWVLEQNVGAKHFYENLGGEKIETVEEMDIGDRPVVKSRYYWASVEGLIKMHEE